MIAIVYVQRPDSGRGTKTTIGAFCRGFETAQEATDWARCYCRQLHIPADVGALQPHVFDQFIQVLGQLYSYDDRLEVFKDALNPTNRCS